MICLHVISPFNLAQQTLWLFYRSFVVYIAKARNLSLRYLSNTSAQLRRQNIAKLHIPWALLRQITACPFHRTCLVITLQCHKHLDDTDIRLFAV